jgi:predicted Zn-dependent peptidase
LFQIFAGIHPKNTAKALKIVSQQLTKLAEKPIPAAELQRAISYACGSGKLGLEGTANMMLWLGESLLFHEKVATVAEAQQRLRQVTGTQVCEMARRIFTPKRFGAAIVGPEDQAEMGI